MRLSGTKSIKNIFCPTTTRMTIHYETFLGFEDDVEENVDDGEGNVSDVTNDDDKEGDDEEEEGNEEEISDDSEDEERGICRSSRIRYKKMYTYD